MRLITVLLFFIAPTISLGCEASLNALLPVKQISEPGECVAVSSLDVNMQGIAGIDRATALRSIPASYTDGNKRLPLTIALAADADALQPAPADRNAYKVTVSSGSIDIVAADSSAVLFAIDQLAAMLVAGNGQLPSVSIVDWADLEIRALHFVLRKVDYATATKLVDKARAQRFNTLFLHLADAVRFDADIIDARQKPLSKQEFINLVEYARDNGLRVIPQVALLTHQEKFFRERYPELMYNYVTYDPRKPEVYELVYAYIDELIEAINPDAIHIGHDEVKGMTRSTKRKWLKKGETFLPPELYLQDILTLNEHLTSLGLEVWMWGDMLIDEPEFPEMGKRNFHGQNGYKELRGKIPRNIVITDWHYHHLGPNFPSAKAFADADHNVLGSSRELSENIRTFASYVAGLGPRGRGMVATTWSTVQKREWDIIDRTIQQSGQWYWEVSD